MTACNFTVALFCRVDDVLQNQKKHPLEEASFSRVVSKRSGDAWDAARFAR